MADRILGKLIRMEARIFARAVFDALYNEAFRGDEHYPACPICGRRDQFAVCGVGNCDKHGGFAYGELSANDIMDKATEIEAQITRRGGHINVPAGFMFSDVVELILK